MVGEVIFEPEYPVEDQQPVILNIPFNEGKWADEPDFKYSWKYEDEFDIDGDSKSEKLYCASIYKNGLFAFVKNDKVIFKGTGWCDRVKGNFNGNGFTSVDMLGASINGIRLLTNYQYVDGGFKVIFYQHICALVD